MLSKTESNLALKSSSRTQKGALEIYKQVDIEAQKLHKNVSVAVLNSQSIVVLLVIGDNLSSHNTEASRRKT